MLDAWKVGQATQHAQKYLEVENVTGMVKVNPHSLAERLVVAFRTEHPGLEGDARLVAAAAYAHGIKLFDRSGDNATADSLFRCLNALLQHDIVKTMDVTMLKGADKILCDMAFEAMETKPAKKTGA
jgi:hypothetical protein